MPESQIEDLENGKYNLFGKFLIFDVKKTNQKIILDKRSALEIMTTLLDSENLLTKEAEELVGKLTDEIEKYY